MPLLDVSDIVSDPDFVSRLTCLRAQQTVGDDGLAVDTVQSIPFFGVVTSNAGDLLDILAEGSRVKGSITIHTMFRLRMAGDDVSADHVLANGREYIVDNINDYSTWGAGFVAATCTIKPLVG